MLFNPEFHTVGNFIWPSLAKKVEMMKNEPMLFNCNYNGAWEKGGPLTKAVLNLIPKEWKAVPLRIDSKTVMLMEGWFPCIPGWHHDDVERKGPFNQPDYVTKDKRAEFILCNLGTEITATEFLCAPVTLDLPSNPATVIYREWDRILNSQPQFIEKYSRKAKEGELILFDDKTFHRGTAATRNGWRWFIRISRYYDVKSGWPIDRGNPVTNEVRNQVQVYLSAVNNGW
jgi:hypothetical protein